MGPLCYEDYCPECGHLLTNDRAMCSFCNWYNLKNIHETVDELYGVDEAANDCDFLYALPQNEHVSPEVTP